MAGSGGGVTGRDMDMVKNTPSAKKMMNHS